MRLLHLLGITVSVRMAWIRVSCGRANSVIDSHTVGPEFKTRWDGTLSTEHLTDNHHTSIVKLSIRWWSPDRAPNLWQFFSTIHSGFTFHTPNTAPCIWMGNLECGVWILRVECESWVWAVNHECGVWILSVECESWVWGVNPECGVWILSMKCESWVWGVNHECGVWILSVECESWVLSVNPECGEWIMSVGVNHECGVWIMSVECWVTVISLGPGLTEDIKMGRCVFQHVWRPTSMNSTTTGRPVSVWQSGVSCPVSAAWHTSVAAYWTSNLKNSVK